MTDNERKEEEKERKAKSEKHQKAKSTGKNLNGKRTDEDMEENDDEREIIEEKGNKNCGEIAGGKRKLDVPESQAAKKLKREQREKKIAAKEKYCVASQVRSYIYILLFREAI